jgi:leucyl-tRNA synthetase
VQSEAGPRRATLDFAVDSLLLLLAPMAPHLAAELWERRHPGEPSVHEQTWPVADPSMLAVDTQTMVVQVNGKVRDRLEVPTSISEADAVAAALASPRMAGVEPKRVVARPPRLVNFVV